MTFVPVKNTYSLTIKQQKSQVYRQTTFVSYISNMHCSQYHILQICVFLLIVSLCSHLIRHDGYSGRSCRRLYWQADKERACAENLYYFNLVEFLGLQFTNQNLTKSTWSVLDEWADLFEWPELLLVYLLPIAAYRDAEQTRQLPPYVRRRFMRLTTSISVGLTIFILPTTVHLKLADYGLTIRYLYSAGEFDKNFVMCACSLLLYELLLLSIFFYGKNIVSAMRKLFQWSLKYLTVVVFEFIVLSIMANGFIDFFQIGKGVPGVSLLHFGFLIYCVQMNQNLKSKVEEHTLRISIFTLCSRLMADHRWLPRFLPNRQMFIGFMEISLCYLLVLFLFSVFSNFWKLKYTIKTSSSNDTNKLLLAETA